ncbi:MAG: CPBP family intramembrane metalloprotease [Hyphomonadaceae bacterium]|nr:CPBP family intramembrane metalloprotease [Hyphomonadaceae bacterium]
MALNPFINAQGRLRSGWWLAFFLLVLLALLAPLIVLASNSGAGVPIWQQALAVLAASIICQLLRRRPLQEMLGPFGGSWLAQAATGGAIGFALMAAPAAALAALGAVRFELAPLDAAALASAFWLFVGVAVTEELMFRGFAFQRLIDGLGLWPAQVIGASFFVLTHSDALKEIGALGLLAGLNIFIAALMFGFAFLRTRSLAMPIGIHLIANFTQGALLGFGVSGGDMQGWLRPALVGPDWLTGGAFGLEASVPGLICVSAVTVLLARYAGTNRKAAPLLQ